ncbi:MAG: hypothetical protein RIC93_12290 [Alphaproteobacteria bacterium]
MAPQTLPRNRDLTPASLAGLTPPARLLLWAARAWLRGQVTERPACQQIRGRFHRAGWSQAFGYFDGFMHFLNFRQPLPPDFDRTFGPDLTALEEDFIASLAALQRDEADRLVMFARARVACAPARIAARHVAMEMVSAMSEAGGWLEAPAPAGAPDLSLALLARTRAPVS